jgi:hypothetical protein
MGAVLRKAIGIHSVQSKLNSSLEQLRMNDSRCALLF